MNTPDLTQQRVRELFRVAVDTTVAEGALICWWDRGSALTLADTDAYTPSVASGIFTLS